MWSVLAIRAAAELRKEPLFAYTLMVKLVPGENIPVSNINGHVVSVISLQSA